MARCTTVYRTEGAFIRSDITADNSGVNRSIHAQATCDRPVGGPTGRRRTLTIAALGRGWWAEAVCAAGHECIPLPALPTDTCFDSTIEQRIAHGRLVHDMLRGRRVDFILDMYGDGMLFVEDPASAGPAALLHHVLGVPLVSHWTESFRILFKRVDPVLVQTMLASSTWRKAIFTRGHLRELQWMGVGGCFYLPLAADAIDYPTGPRQVRTDGPDVLFAGSQQSRYFSHADGVDVRTQWPGLLALAAVEDRSCESFLDAYRQYGMGPSPAEEATPAARAEAIRRYYERKMVFIAARNLALRDRFVLRLHRELGDHFLLIGGDRWRSAYGIESHPRVDRPAYERLIRETPICLNMVNGDNDTGLNLRPFEVTAFGGFLLSHHQEELGEHFEIGRECEFFRNETELLDKVRYYTAHPEKRERIARAGHERTMSEHLLRHRVDAVVARLAQEGLL